ncbi:Lysophospholipid acyltransferase [Carpediemonas membranifera]|uniref:Lysophospholipid acyltransferase n=1 Tax=Carpediemonas membranifera TaxID=201153 RepID=A0A8J6DXX3_9EUKA|nr:Lysophospholipid acyltransferase [Carpediemonas membranifera]|eukprot:KAG9391149.1 Lysophospholipid acyltransferase [Carpediemonas membranifera]
MSSQQESSPYQHLGMEEEQGGIESNQVEDRDLVSSEQSDDGSDYDEMEALRERLRTCRFSHSKRRVIQQPALLEKITVGLMVPFVHHLTDKKAGLLVRIKIFVSALFLVPFRLLGLFIGMTYIPIWQLILSIGAKKPHHGNIGVKRQRLCDLNMIVTGYGALFFTGLIPKVIRHDGATVKREDAVIVSNHMSWVDPLIHAALFRPSFAATVGITRIPTFIFCSIVQTVLLHRGTAGTETVATSISARDNNPAMPPLVIFPEGTTTNGLGLIPFKPGAFIAGVPVNPVVIRYPNAASVAWDTCSLSYAVLRTVTQLINRAEVHILPRYVPTEEEKADPLLYADNVRRYMARKTGLELFDARIRHKHVYEGWKNRGRPGGFEELKSRLAQVKV